jgi:hypothetical protein
VAELGRPESVSPRERLVSNGREFSFVELCEGLLLAHEVPDECKRGWPERLDPAGWLVLICS